MIDRVEAQVATPTCHACPTSTPDSHDTAQLVVCDTCALTYPRTDDDGYAAYAARETCEHCAAGQLVDHDQRHRIPSLADRLNILRTRLAAPR